MHAQPHRLPLARVFDILHADGIIALTARDNVRLERLLRSRDDWSVPLLAQSAAALLATSPESWQRIHDRIVELLTPPADPVEPPPASIPGPASEDDTPAPPLAGSEPSPRAEQRRQRRARAAKLVGRIRGLTWALLLAGVALAAVAAWLAIPDSWIFEKQPEPEPPARTELPTPPAPAAEVVDVTLPETFAELQHPRDRRDITRDHSPLEPLPAATALAVALAVASLAFAWLGLRW
jgi:hypothetical protein